VQRAVSGDGKPLQVEVRDGQLALQLAPLPQYLTLK
jgi:hypothetical protein